MIRRKLGCCKKNSWLCSLEKPPYEIGKIPEYVKWSKLVQTRIKWDHFEILATGRSDMHCKIKESLLIRDLKPALNENVGSEKLDLYN